MTITTRRIKGTRKGRGIPRQGEEDHEKDKTITGRIGKVISMRQKDEEKKITRR